MKQYLGWIYALLAALFNGMIGCISVQAMSIGLSPYAVAFYKCFIGLLAITGWLIVSKRLGKWLQLMRSLWWQLLIAAFFGFFVLYFFETAAYNHEKVTVVVFMLLGSALLTTFSLSAILDKRRVRLLDLLTCLLAILGLALIFGVQSTENTSRLGVFLALLAGVGYGIFLTVTPRFKIGSGLLVVNSFLLFGSVYLFVPFAMEGLVPIPNLAAATFLIVAALLPTIGGFLCTTKALTLLKSESVQLIELSEPLFAFLFSFFFLHQQITPWQIAGGALLISSIYLNMHYAQKEVIT